MEIPEKAVVYVNTDKYADDCKTDTFVKSGESSVLQSALDSVHSWEVGNKMELNDKKTNSMWNCFTGEPPPLPTLAHRRCFNRISK
jgi:hypothetical protein